MSKEVKKEVKTTPVNGAAPVSGPLTEDEVKKNAQEEDRKTMRVIQVIQHVEGQKIEVIPIQNIPFRSDVVGILAQALENYTITDITQNTVMLLRETVGLINTKLDELLSNKEKTPVESAAKEVDKSDKAPK